MPSWDYERDDGLYDWDVRCVFQGERAVNKVVSFDLEIVKEISDDIENWRDIRPLGISCAAVLPNTDALSTLFYHREQDTGLPKSGCMTKEEAGYLVKHLMWEVDGGSAIITWNGLGFDFDVLAEESGMHEECAELALNHIDMAFHFLCVKGYMIGLNAAATGLGFGGKMAGMTGAKAPEMWASELLRDRLRVLRYVHQDVVSTLEVFEQSSDWQRIPWISKSGKPNVFNFREWLPVRDCLNIPKPDNSWMDKPMEREDFYAWITK
jgi:hypothetical protein